jgi:FkbM family methyltransferase
MKNVINKLIRPFKVEIHGIGYLKKIKKSEFKENPIDLLKKLFPKSKIIFDVGANNGSMSKEFLLNFTNSHVFAFEPLVEFQQLFQKEERITYNQLVLSDKIGQLEFNVNKSLDTSSILQSKKIGANSDEQCQTIEKRRVNSVTLDSYCKSNKINQIDILKIDTQGGELSILKGSVEMLTKGQIKCIFCETYFKEQYVDQPLFYEIGIFLQNFGYHLSDFSNPYYNENSLLWCDAIFIKS